MTHDAFVSIRKDMLDGRVIPGCWKCIREEKVGPSMRTKYNSVYRSNGDTVRLQYLEVSFGNYCNLGCRTCSSSVSTGWFDDDKALSEVYDDRAARDKIIEIPFNWKPDDFQYMKEIKFVGGEPMLNPNFVKFIDTLVASGRSDQIELTIFTNVSWFPKPSVFKKILTFKKVNFWLSIDAVGGRNDYIRHNSKWDDVNKNTNMYLDLESKNNNIFITLTPTFNLLNSQYIDELIDWWFDVRNNHLLNDGIAFSSTVVFSAVYHPEEYSTKNIPNKENLIAKWNDEIQFNSLKLEHGIIYQKLVNMVSRDLNVSYDLTKFIQMTKDLDHLRGQDFKSIFPELYMLIGDELYRKTPGRLLSNK